MPFAFLSALVASVVVQRSIPIPTSRSPQLPSSRTPQPPCSSAVARPLARSLAADDLSMQFQAFAAEHYVPFAAVQMGVVRLTSDIVAQSTHAAAVDPVHAMAMTVTGITCSGAGGALWLRYLENQVGPNEDGSRRLVVFKALADYVCWSPTVNSANLFFVSLLMGHGLEASFSCMVTGLPSLMLLELCIFGPYNLIGFSLIPPDLRPSAKALASFVFSMYLSLSC